jgi:hypothetical protein
MIKEDKWDFMLNSPNQILHDHILEIETGHDFSEEVIFKKRKDNLISTFSVVDINLL